MRLSGYGVELAIKSTEYKAKDDTKVEGWKGFFNVRKSLVLFVICFSVCMFQCVYVIQFIK